MSGPIVLAIDQGTTNTKAVAVDADGRIVAQASVPMTVLYPRPGWAEQSASAIWQSVREVIASIMSQTGPDSIAAIGISNQRETIVVWDAETGEAIAPAVIWQCRRSADRCAAIRVAGHEAKVIARTGLAIDPLFPAAKLAWILDEVPGARQRAEAGELRAGTVDSWLIWNLTGGREHATDHSNASRTQLFDTAELRWHPELAAIFDVPTKILSTPLPSDSLFGRVAEGATALPAGTPIYAAIGDSHAALYGHGVRHPGQVKATYGTGTSLMTLTEQRVSSRHGLSGTIAWSTSDGVAYALEGNISVSGQAAAFMAELLGLRSVEELAVLASTVSDSNGVNFVPALVGLGAPHWQPDARGTITGLSLGTKPAHLARAAIEAIASQVADVHEAMENDLGARLVEVMADGGASRNDMLMQLQADLLGQPVTRGDIAELSAIGAAAMAFRGLDKTMPTPTGTERFVPSGNEGERGQRRAAWAVAISQTLAGQPARNNR